MYVCMYVCMYLRKRIKCQWNFGRASEKFGVILVKLIDYSGKLPSGPVEKILNSQLVYVCM